MNKIRKYLIGTIAGITVGGIFVTIAGKTILDFGITLLTGASVIGAGFLIGVLTLPKRLLQHG